jgi:hypothetical protein
MMKKLLSGLKPAAGNDRTKLMLCAHNLNMSLEVIRMAENPELLKPLPDEVLRKLQGKKGARSKGSTRK